LISISVFYLSTNSCQRVCDILFFSYKSSLRIQVFKKKKKFQLGHKFEWNQFLKIIRLFKFTVISRIKISIKTIKTCKFYWNNAEIKPINGRKFLIICRIRITFIWSLVFLFHTMVSFDQKFRTKLFEELTNKVNGIKTMILTIKWHKHWTKSVNMKNWCSWIMRFKLMSIHNVLFESRLYWLTVI
jgi:hypothetical protein